MVDTLKNMIILASNESAAFAQEVYKNLKETLDPVHMSTREVGHVRGSYFPSKEIYPQIDSNIRGLSVYYIHNFAGYEGEPEPNIGVMKMALIDDALRDSSPAKITYIWPFVPYLRQDRMDRHRVAISAKRVLRMMVDPQSKILTSAVTFDMHAGQVQGFADYHIDNIYAEPLFYDYLKKRGLKEVAVVGVQRDGELTEKTVDDINLKSYEPVLVSPDTGGATRARSLAKRFNAPMAIIDKRRTGPGQNEVMHLVGEDYIRGRVAIIVDDMIDTGGTVVKGAEALRNAGAADVYACATHGVFSDDSSGHLVSDKMREAGVKVVTTDTIARYSKYVDDNKDWLTILSVAPLTAQAIFETHVPDGSVSRLFGSPRDPMNDDFKLVF